MNLSKLSIFFIYFFTALTFFSCKKVVGPKGETGVDGYTSLIKITSFVPNVACTNGGITIQSGVDKNKNNILDSSEIDQTEDVCNGADGSSDKQIFLPIPNAGSNTSSSTPVITGSLIKFNKDNYAGVDSIIFVADPYVADVSNTSIVELYNITDGEIITNSKLSSSSLFNQRSFIQTGNLYNNLPGKEIIIGIRQYSAKEGFFAASGSSYLFLYRH